MVTAQMIFFYSHEKIITTQRIERIHRVRGFFGMLCVLGYVSREEGN